MLISTSGENVTLNLQNEWEKLSVKLMSRELDINKGRMMSADALTFKGKVFVFYSTKGGREGLGCRVGRETNIDELGLLDWQFLAPFKTKPAMKDWIVAGAGDVDNWMKLSEFSLTKIRDANKPMNS